MCICAGGRLQADWVKACSCMQGSAVMILKNYSNYTARIKIVRDKSSTAFPFHGNGQYCAKALLLSM